MPVDSEQVLGKHCKQQSDHASRFQIGYWLGFLTDSIATAERQNHRLDGEGGREEPPRSRICLLEVDNLGAGAIGKVGCVLKVDR